MPPKKSTGPSKTAQSAAIKQLREFTNATQADAQRLLKAHNWRVEEASNAFWEDPVAQINAEMAGGSNTVVSKSETDSKNKLGKIFDEYKDKSGPDITLDGGALKLFQDLGVDLESDPTQITLSYYLRCPAVGTFTREHYIDGWRAIAPDADTVAKQSKHITRLREELRRDAPIRGNRASGDKGSGGTFKRAYDYVFIFGKAEGQKALKKDAAIAFWDLLLPNSPWFAGGYASSGSFSAEQLDLWKRYLTTKVPDNKTISKDVWSMFFDFHKTAKPGFTDHDADGAWPSMIDEFVEWVRSGEANAMDVE